MPSNDADTRQKVELTPSGKPVVHGKASSYNNHKCRCEDCTTAWAKYIAEGGYVKKHRDKKKPKRHVRINL